MKKIFQGDRERLAPVWACVSVILQNVGWFWFGSRAIQREAEESPSSICCQKFPFEGASVFSFLLDAARFGPSMNPAELLRRILNSPSNYPKLDWEKQNNTSAHTNTHTHTQEKKTKKQQQQASAPEILQSLFQRKTTEITARHKKENIRKK